MKVNRFIVLLALIYLSCRERSQEEDFRQRIDKIKKEELPKMNYSVSQFYIDSAKPWQVISQVTIKKKSGVISTLIKTKIESINQLAIEQHAVEIDNEINQKTQFQGQILFRTTTGILLYYLLYSEKNASLIYKLSWGSNKNFNAEALDSVKYKDWSKIKLAIINKQK